MWGLLALAATLAVSWVSYGTARRFVRERLRYVEAALKPTAAIVAGVVALVVAWPVIGLIHWIPIVGSLVGGGTAVVFGLSVGLGVNAGAKDVRSGIYLGPGA
ncbi:MAG: hypothetical protein HY084_12500 [Gemmatimonadetes bacterium]|nr:hypothetical protein [Gemmatimonadota bacterium]